VAGDAWQRLAIGRISIAAWSGYALPSCGRVVRRLLIAAAVLLGGPAMAQVDPKITETCMRAQDFAGCVQTLSGGLPPKQQKDAEEGLRTWTREDGTIIRMRKASVVALKNKDGYGRYLEYTYGLKIKHKITNGSYKQTVLTTPRIGTRTLWAGLALKTQAVTFGQEK
jgi:hypothetical protein